MSVVESVSGVGPEQLQQMKLTEEEEEITETKRTLPANEQDLKKEQQQQQEDEDEEKERSLESKEIMEELEKALQNEEECEVRNQTDLEKLPEEKLDEELNQKSLEEPEIKKIQSDKLAEGQPEKSHEEEQGEELDPKPQKEEIERDQLEVCSEKHPEESQQEDQSDALDEKPLEKPQSEKKSEDDTQKDKVDERLEPKTLEEDQSRQNQKDQLEDSIEKPPKESQEEEQSEGQSAIETHLEEGIEKKIEKSQQEEPNREAEPQNENILKEQIEKKEEAVEEELKNEENPREQLNDDTDKEKTVELLDEKQVEVEKEIPSQQLEDCVTKEPEPEEILELAEQESEAENHLEQLEKEKEVGKAEDQQQAGEDPPPLQVANEEQADRPNETVRETLRQLLQNLWPDLNSTEFDLERASAKGDNYLGVVWRICVRSREVSLVLKLPPQNSVRRKQFFARPCFLRESLAYEHFLPLVAEFQRERNVPLEEQFIQYARCQACRLDEPNECIVLEDLCRSGYDLHDRFADLPVECVRLVMRAYAKLHATSLAIKQQWPGRLRICQSLVDIFEQRRDDHSLGVYFENLKQSALDALRSSDCSTEDRGHYVERLEAYFARGTFFELLLPLIGGANCEPYAVICHGDCWNNNIMYRLDDVGRPLDVRLIDWQLMRYASPITDLAYFFFSCTSREFRRNYYKPMLETYYTELVQQLNRLGESADELFPLQAFQEQLQSKCAVGLLLAMMVLPIVTMRGQDVPDLEAISELIEAGGTTSLKGAGFLGSGNEDLYKERMRDVIIDCVDNGYI